MCSLLSGSVLPSQFPYRILLWIGSGANNNQGKQGERELVFMLLGGLSCYKGFISKSYELGSAMHMCSVFKILVNFFKNLGLCLGKK